MNKPIIAIFCKGNLPTEAENQLIHSLAMYPCIILNAETYTPQESLVVNAVTGVIPEQFKGYPTPEEAIAEYEQFLKEAGSNVGGLPQDPPQNTPKDPPQDPPQDPPPSDDDNKGDNEGSEGDKGNKGTQNQQQGGFRQPTPPTPPKP